MYKFVGFNNQIISSENTFLSAISSAAFYGKGVFTTLAIYNSKPFLWEKHWERLRKNAEKIGIDFSQISEDEVSQSLGEIISKNKIINARARITFFDESANGIWSFRTNRKTSFLITTGDFRAVLKKFQLTVSPFLINSTSPLVGVKSCNYLENILAFDDAKAKGFDETIRLNERGEIVSACMANVFWVKNEKIFTPSLETGCLSGTTRSFIIENFPVEERKIGLTEINDAGDVFLTSSGFGILRISKIDKTEFAESSETFNRVKCFFDDFVKNYK